MYTQGCIQIIAVSVKVSVNQPVMRKMSGHGYGMKKKIRVSIIQGKWKKIACNVYMSHQHNILKHVSNRKEKKSRIGEKDSLTGFHDKDFTELGLNGTEFADGNIN